jgi:hypothetical protein
LIALIGLGIAVSLFYRVFYEYKIARLGTCKEAVIVSVPHYCHRAGTNYLHVFFEEKSVKVRINSGPCYRKEFEIGQIVTIKYYEPDAAAIIENQQNWWHLLKAVSLIGLAFIVLDLGMKL